MTSHLRCMRSSLVELLTRNSGQQFGGSEVSRTQRLSKPIAGLFWGSILVPIIVVGIVAVSSPNGGYDPSYWAWIDVIYAFSYVKVVITVVKYLPQAWLNYKRQSTEGWSISQILLDLAGGILSLVQLVLDSSLQSDWSGITGNPIKLLLGNITIVSDVVFVVQHYILYRDQAGPKAQPARDITTPLLGDAEAS
ncbi:L-cystine transporter [Penicillium chermesinum]|uniref:L-cystine transporter n=1 Tax=Penicillium chermesinum TaxID=63820 RepID=A0A9W9TW16_9EURO|nr:L-cystine transporter [Penicillium chermesinum]KAJ5245871.1 L-cystine transporter [Penicillium chermesinum]